MQENNTFMQLAQKQVELFQNNNIAWMDAMVTSDCIKGIMCIAYRAFVREKKITAIEDMPIGEKKKLWEQAKEFAKNRLNQQEMVDLCRSLLTLEYML